MGGRGDDRVRNRVPPKARGRGIQEGLVLGTENPSLRNPAVPQGGGQIARQGGRKKVPSVKRKGIALDLSTFESSVAPRRPSRDAVVDGRTSALNLGGGGNGAARAILEGGPKDANSILTGPDASAKRTS